FTVDKVSFPASCRQSPAQSSQRQNRQIDQSPSGKEETNRFSRFLNLLIRISHIFCQFFSSTGIPLLYKGVEILHRLLACYNFQENRRFQILQILRDLPVCVPEGNRRFLPCADTFQHFHSLNPGGIRRPSVGCREIAV